MNILAIDLGMQMGWAMRRDGILLSGTLDLHESRYEGGGMRYVRFGDWLGSLKDIDRVAYEEVRGHKGPAAAHAYGGFRAVLMAWCERQKIPYEAIPVGTIKKRATSKGNADKEAMLVSARVNWPDQNVRDDNQADALWLLDCVERTKL